MAVSATLAANEVVEQRRRAGLPVLPMSFGQAGVPVHPLLTAALTEAAGRNAYGPVAGDPDLQAAAAGYWARRGLPTEVGQVVSGPGSKALLYTILQVVGGPVLLSRPSWVSYAAQATLLGTEPVFVPTRPGEGGVPDPDAIGDAARASGARVMVLTLPDNPTGRLAPPATVRAACEVARTHDLVVVSDEIYRDLVYPDIEFASAAEFAPERVIVTTGLSKHLALGGWRTGVARFPGELSAVRDGVVSVASELWSCASRPVEAAAAVAFAEPAALVSYVDSARRLYQAINTAVADRFAEAGAVVAPPQASFYCYPDLGRGVLAGRTGADVAAMFLDRHGLAMLPGVEFGEPVESLSFRVATGQLTGETDEQRRAAVAAADPLALPWVSAALTRLSEILAAELR